MHKLIWEVLVATDELLSDESKWTKRAAAKDGNGSSLLPNDPGACCWCFIGALEKAGGGDHLLCWYVRQHICETIRGFDGHGSLVTWNDQKSTTFEDVKRVLREAIEAIPAM